jgi:pimeloyl-ACP methyl ester carboxylesterase
MNEAPSTMQQLADDVSALFDELGVKEPVCFCGLSMGGYVGWQFLRRHGSRLRGLVQCDTRAVADAPDAVKTRTKMAKMALESGMQPIAEAMLPKLTAEATAQHRPQVIAELREMMIGNNPAGAAAALRGMAERPSAVEWLGEISVPTLLIVGEDDKISTADEMRQIAQKIPGAELLVVPNAGHMAPLENPTPVNAALIRFLNRL